MDLLTRRRAMMQAQGAASGSLWTTDGIAAGTEPNGDLTIHSDLVQYAFYYKTEIRKVVYYGKTLPISAFQYSGITEFHAASNFTLAGLGLSNSTFANCNSLVFADLGNVPRLANSTTFQGCSNLKTLILRSTTLVAMPYSPQVFRWSAFWENGTGGTIYIPKVLYDELDTGSADDYESAINWSTVCGYGKITWAPIEGSPYETPVAGGPAVS